MWHSGVVDGKHYMHNGHGSNNNIGWLVLLREQVQPDNAHCLA